MHYIIKKKSRWEEIKAQIRKCTQSKKFLIRESLKMEDMSILSNGSVGASMSQHGSLSLILSL